MQRVISNFGSTAPAAMANSSSYAASSSRKDRRSFIVCLTYSGFAAPISREKEFTEPDRGESGDTYQVRDALRDEEQ